MRADRTRGDRGEDRGPAPNVRCVNKAHCLFYPRPPKDISISSRPWFTVCRIRCCIYLENARLSYLLAQQKSDSVIRAAIKTMYPILNNCLVEISEVMQKHLD